MSNEFGACTNSLNETIKNDSIEKPVVMDRHCINGPASLPAAVVPPTSATDIPRTNINVGSTSWNYNPYFSNFYNYYTSQTYDLGDVSHQYNQKCGTQFACNYQQSLAQNSVLQCCDPRCQLLSGQPKYPYSQTLCSKSHQKSKRSRGYYGGLLDLPKPDITSRPPPDYAAPKYTPVVPYSMNDLNNKYSSQQMSYNAQYHNAVKSPKSVFLAESTAYTNTDYSKQTCWNKPNLWNHNLSSSYYSSIQQNRVVNHKFPVPFLEQNGMTNAVKHNILHNHSTLESRSALYDGSYIPNYHYMNNRQNQSSNSHEHIHMNEEYNYSHFPSIDNSHQFQPTYNTHCSIPPNGPDSHYKELVLKPSEISTNKQHTVDKGSNLDVREFLSTWDDGGEDDKPPESEAPVIVLDCTSLEGDALAKVKEKLGDTISDCNALDNSVTTICELGSQSNTTVLKVVDDPNSAIGLLKHPSVIQNSNNNHGKTNNFPEKPVSESSHLNSDGFMTWYSNTKKQDEHSYDLVEMTERIVNTVDKLFSEPEKKNMSKSNSSSLVNSGYQLPSHNILDENYIESEWNINFNSHKKDYNRPTQNIAINHYSNHMSKNAVMNDPPTNMEKSSCRFTVNKITGKPVIDTPPPATDYSATSSVQDYSLKYKSSTYKNSPDYYHNHHQTGSTTSGYQYYNSYYGDTNNMNGSNSCGSMNIAENNSMSKQNSSTNYVDQCYKNSFSETDRADLEKSLNDITNDLKNHSQKERDTLNIENPMVSRAQDSQDSPNSPTDSMDLGKNILEIGSVISKSTMRATSVTAAPLSSYNSVIQKIGECNSTISEVNEDASSCENSLLSMPSLSPPPAKIAAMSAHNVISYNNHSNYNDSSHTRHSKENDILNEEIPNIPNVGKPSFKPEGKNSGHLNQPLNLTMDLTKSTDLQTCASRVDDVFDQKLSREAEEENSTNNKNIDLNSNRANHDYYLAGNHSNHENKYHELPLNSKEILKSEDNTSERITHIDTYQTCIVSCKQHENLLKEDTTPYKVSPRCSPNIKSVSAPPSLVDMSESISSQKPKPFRSVGDLQAHFNPLPLPLQKDDYKETSKSNEDELQFIHTYTDSIYKTAADDSKENKSIGQPILAENDCTTSVIVHKEITSTNKSMNSHITALSGIEEQLVKDVDQNTKLLNHMLEESKELIECAQDCYKSSNEHSAIYCKDPKSACPQESNNLISTNSINKIRNTHSRSLNRLNGDLNELSKSQLSIDYNNLEHNAKLSTFSNSTSETETTPPRKQIIQDPPASNTFINSCHVLATIEEQEFGKPVEELQKTSVCTPVKSWIKSPLRDSTPTCTSVISLPSYSSKTDSMSTLKNGTNHSESNLQRIEEHKDYKNDITYKSNHRKKFKHKKHKSRKSHIHIDPYKNSREMNEEKSIEQLCENNSVIKENTNLLNTNHSPLYPIRSVQDLEMKLSNIRQRLPNDTFLYKCVSRDSSPTDFKDQLSEIKAISETSMCQNENKLPTITEANNPCKLNKLTSCSTSENLKLGKHLFNHKNADLPMKKRKQDVSLDDCSEEYKSKDESLHHSKNSSNDGSYNGKLKFKFHESKSFGKYNRRFSYTEDPEAVLNNSIARKDILRKYRRSKSLIDWYKNEDCVLDSYTKLQSSLSFLQQKYSNINSTRLVSSSNPCIANIQEEKFTKLSTSLPASPSIRLQEEENFTLSGYIPLQYDDFSLNNRSLQFNDKVMENDNISDLNYYDYSIPSVAPTPQCDLGKEDRFESDLVESCHKSNSLENDYHSSDVFVHSPVLNTPSTPNCDFLVNEGISEDFTTSIHSNNEKDLSECSCNEDAENTSSKAPSPCCILNDVIIDEIPEQNLYVQPFTALSPASSVAPSPQCDIIDGVILDNQDFGDSVAECDNNNNHHSDVSVCIESASRAIYGVPTLQSLAFEALDGISTEHKSSNTDNSNNMLELWVTSEHTEIIIHSEDQQATTDVVVPEEVESIIETSELHSDILDTSDHFVNTVTADESVDSLIQSTTTHNEVDGDDIQCQSVIIGNEESIIEMQCSSSSQTVELEADFHEHVDTTVDNSYINGCPVDDEFQFSNNCIEESFIDQKMSCSPIEPPAVEQMCETSSFIEMSGSTCSSPMQMKVQLPWYKIFNLNDALHNYDVGLLKELELGPAQIEVRLSSSGSKLWKVVNSRPEFLSSVLKVKRLVLQPAASTLNEDEENNNELFSPEAEPPSACQEDRMDPAITNNNDDQEVECQQARQDVRFNSRKVSKVNKVNGIVGVPKVVIRKTSCRQYQSYLQNNDLSLPIVRLNRYKYLDELAQKSTDNGTGSININDLRRITSPQEELNATKDSDQALGHVNMEENEHCMIEQGNNDNNLDERLSTTSVLDDVIKLHKKSKDAAVGDGTALFPKSLPERHHCLLCHRSYSSEELYQSHVKSKLHRHLELTQRKTIHAMYRYFTGHLCPRLRLLSAKERKKMKWKPRKTNVHHFYHQKTPLQIALHKSVYDHRK